MVSLYRKSLRTCLGVLYHWTGGRGVIARYTLYLLFLVEFLNFDIDTVMDTQYLENVSADPRELGRGHKYLRP